MEIIGINHLELLEIAYLTLDEPEMETSIVENDDYVDGNDVVVL